MTGSPARSRRRSASARAPRAGSSSPQDGRFAYTGNATGSISGFAIQRDGSLRALNADGLTALAPRPNDLAIVGNTLYAVNPADAGGHGLPDRAATAASTELPRLAPLGTSLAGLAAR